MYQRKSPVPSDVCVLMKALYGRIIRPSSPLGILAAESTRLMKWVMWLAKDSDRADRMSNLILLDDEERIIDSLRRVDTDITGRRQVLPGMFYQYPPAQDKRNPLKTSAEIIQSIVGSAPIDARADKWLIDNFFGLSPLVAREIAFRATGDVSPVFYEMTSEVRQCFAEEISYLFTIIQTGKMVPYMLFDEETPYDFTFIPITQYGNKYRVERLTAFTACGTFYEERSAAARLHQQRQILKSCITGL